MTSTRSGERPELIVFTLTHAMLRDELPRLAAALAGGRMTPGQEAVLEGHIRLVTDHLVRHHQEEDEFLWPRLESRAPEATALLGALKAEHTEMDPLVERVRNRARPRPERSAAMVLLAQVVLAHLDEEDRSVVPLLAAHITAEEQREGAARSRAKIPLAEELRVLAMMQAAAGPAEQARMLAPLPDSVVQLLSDSEAPALRRVHQVLGNLAAGTVPHAPRQGDARQTSRLGIPARIGAWTRSALRDLVYCGAVCVWSVAAFAILVSGVSVTAPLLILVIGVVVWIGLVYVSRWATSLDRALAGWRRHQTVRAVYRRPPGPGLVALLKTLSSDPQTWKDLGWLALAPLAGFTLGLAVITAASTALAFVTMPAWYWAVSDPQHEYGVTNLGLFTVDTIREALITTAIGVAIIPMVLMAARGVATLYGRLAIQVLARPGSPAAPTSRPTERNGS